MATPNYFDSDAFDLIELTAAINDTPYVPGRLGELGLFSEDGISTLTAVIESDGTTLGLVSVQPRNAPGQIVTNDKRKVSSFAIPHLPERATLMADEVQGVRAFGSETERETLDGIRNRRLAKMRAQIDYTIEAHRMAAVQGTYYDANGATVSLFTTFGVSQQTVQMVLDTAGTEVKGKCLDIQEAVESALGGLPYTGLRVLCGSSFWRKWITHSKVKESYLNTNAAAALRGDPRDEFLFGGPIMWERYRGTSVCKIPDTEAYVIPMGVPELFITRFAPANYMETVNTMGIPYYAKAEVLDFGKGVALEAQSNPLNLCTRPRAVIRLVENT